MGILNFDRDGSDYIDEPRNKASERRVSDKQKLINLFETELKPFLNTSPRIVALYFVIVNSNEDTDYIDILVSYIQSTESVLLECQQSLSERLSNG
jgi:hypothetical protein